MLHMFSFFLSFWPDFEVWNNFPETSQPHTHTRARSAHTHTHTLQRTFRRLDMRKSWSYWGMERSLASVPWPHHQWSLAHFGPHLQGTPWSLFFITLHSPTSKYLNHNFFSYGIYLFSSWPLLHWPIYFFFNHLLSSLAPQPVKIPQYIFSVILYQFLKLPVACIQ